MYKVTVMLKIALTSVYLVSKIEGIVECQLCVGYIGLERLLCGMPASAR